MTDKEQPQVSNEENEDDDLDFSKLKKKKKTVTAATSTTSTTTTTTGAGGAVASAAKDAKSSVASAKGTSSGAAKPSSKTTSTTAAPAAAASAPKASASIPVATRDATDGDGDGDDETFNFGAKKKKAPKSVAFAPTVQTKKFTVAAVPDDDATDDAAGGNDDDDEDDDGDDGDDDGDDELDNANDNDDDGADIDFADDDDPNSAVSADGSTASSSDGSRGATAAKEKKPAAWLGTTRDYTYDELVDRIYELLNADRPDLAGGRKKYQMKPPRVCREGTKKTVWVNFPEMCRSMHRQTDHVLQYVLAELGAQGSIDGASRLVIRGRFQPKQIENVVRHYISEYVTCRTCKSPDTQLTKENRLFFLCCETCHSRRTVSAIRKGFEAQIGKRKKMREATETALQPKAAK